MTPSLHRLSNPERISPERILFITATRIGDAVLSTGLLAHLLQTFPAARLTIAAGQVAAPLFAGVPRLEQLISLQKKPYAVHWAELWQAVAARRWRMVVDLRGSLIAWLLNARERRIMAKGSAQEHRVEQLARLFRLEPPPSPRIWTRPQDEAAATALLPADAESRPLLAIGPAANWRGKQWRAERFAELARGLTDRNGPFADGLVLVMAAEHEREQALPLLTSLRPGQGIDLVGRVDLLTAAALLRRVDLFIGNDTGLMHIAAAAGAPTLGLFGPSSAVQYRPWGPSTAVAQTPLTHIELTTSPGFDHRTTDTLMDSLSVDVVVDAATRLVRGHAGATTVPASAAVR